jgi:hypothetical protein
MHTKAANNLLYIIPNKVNCGGIGWNAVVEEGNFALTVIISYFV